MASPVDIALYVHIPFCRSRCRYCDFYSVPAPSSSLVDRTLDALILSLDAALEDLEFRSLRTLFIGGGTPSLIPPERLASFLFELRRRAPAAEEWTCEVNPESLTVELLDALSAGGVDRISLGVQTYDGPLLEWLGRPAGLEALERADALLAEFWTGRLSRDLLAALPRRIGGLKADMDRALLRDPGHLSLYELTLEAGNPLIPDLPDENFVLNEWRGALEELERRGYHRYEVSNFARPGHACRHNLCYWRMQPFLGIGPGAASTLPGAGSSVIRKQEPRDLLRWLENPLGSASREVLKPGDLALEHVMMALRLAEGLSRRRFEAVFALDPLRFPSVHRWERAGILEITDAAVRPTARGLDMIDSVIVDLAGELDELSLSCDWPGKREDERGSHSGHLDPGTGAC